jgi:hypothetical protein
LVSRLQTQRGDMLPRTPEPRSCEARQASRQWLGLALAALVLAGLFALAVVIGRTPPFDRFVTDPLFFKRALVAHVNLALFAWLYAFVVSLSFALPDTRPGGLARRSAHLSALGILCILFGAGVPQAPPLLANYVPTIGHPLFVAGQIAFAAGVVLAVLDRRTPARARTATDFLALPPTSVRGLRAACVALALAAATLVVTWLRLPADLSPDLFADHLVWGVGHVLQLVSTLAMLAVWAALLEGVLGVEPVSPRGATALFGALLLPWTLAPVFAAAGPSSAAYQLGFTSLMRWCIFPGVLAFLALSARALLHARREGRLGTAALGDARLSAFLVSAGLTLVGFALGALIRGSNTMVPAHYHASVGAVTVAFMAGTWLLLPAYRTPVPERLRRAAAWQPVVYGAGMLVFAVGFAVAGAHGMGRKVYGAEQAARGAAETLGLSLMGLGGFVAIAGGVLFLAIACAAWWRRAPAPSLAVRLAAGPGR